jgi:hypothetical protein
MPTFRWKGRSADGKDVSGETKGQSKESVIAQLRGLRIQVSSIAVTGGGDSGDTGPIAADLLQARSATSEGRTEGLAARLSRDRVEGRPNRLKGMFIVGLFVTAGLGVGLMAPIVVCRCERTGAGPVDATLRERDLGLFTIREQKLAGLTSVDVETRFFSERRGTSNERKAESRIVLRGPQSATIRPTAWGQDGGLGSSTSQMQQAIERFLAESSQSQMSIWQGQWVPLLLAALLLLIGLLMLIATLLSSFRGPTEWVYDSVGKLAASADAKREPRGNQASR